MEHFSRRFLIWGENWAVFEAIIQKIENTKVRKFSFRPVMYLLSVLFSTVHWVNTAGLTAISKWPYPGGYTWVQHHTNCKIRVGWLSAIIPHLWDDRAGLWDDCRAPSHLQGVMIAPARGCDGGAIIPLHTNHPTLIYSLTTAAS